MDQNELNEILEKHALFLKGKSGGERADLCNKNLDFEHLEGANLHGADLSYADLTCASLENVDLSGANLTGAELHLANLKGANLQRADLINTGLTTACLVHADLTGAWTYNADFLNANLTGAVLDGIRQNHTTKFLNLQCPEEGSFIGWKKGACGAIIKLLIPEDAKRSSATSRKCRCDKAEVLKIYDQRGNEIKSAESRYDCKFVYKVGKTVSADNFDANRWNECAPGIHFFITREEAENY